MRLAFLAFLALLVTACAGPSPSPVLGVWQSNRELTLAEFREAGSFTEAQWKVLSDPAFFGHMVHIYSGSAGMTVFDGECSAMNGLEILSSSKDSVELRYFSELLGEDWNVRLEIAGEHLYVPIEHFFGGQLRETFTRVSAESVAERHPCTRLILKAMLDDA